MTALRGLVDLLLVICALYVQILCCPAPSTACRFAAARHALSIARIEE